MVAMQDIITAFFGRSEERTAFAPDAVRLLSDVEMKTLSCMSGIVMKGIAPPKKPEFFVEGVFPVTTLPMLPILRVCHLLAIFQPLQPTLKLPRPVLCLLTFVVGHEADTSKSDAKKSAQFIAEAVSSELAQFVAIPLITCGLLLHLDDEKVVLGAAMMDNNVGEHSLGFKIVRSDLLTTAHGHPLGERSIAIVFAVNIPVGEFSLEVLCKLMSDRPLTGIARQQVVILSIQLDDGTDGSLPHVRDRWVHLLSRHIRTPPDSYDWRI
jgi:hypothetical protein